MKKLSLSDIRKKFFAPLQGSKRYVVILCALFTSCELTVDIDVPVESEQLVLNSFFHPDSVWSATLSVNQHILDSLPVKRIENATIVVYDQDAPVDTLVHLGDGVYRSDTGKPLSGHSYTIKATVPGYPDIMAQSHVPASTTISEVEVVDGVSEDGYPEKIFTIKFSDDPNAMNYYQVYLETEHEFLTLEGQIRPSRFYIAIDSDDPTIQDRDIYHNGLLIKDVFFQNGNGVVSISAPLYNVSVSNVIVGIRTLSENYYRYKTTGSLQENTSDNPFAQPVNVYDNVENGFGIFAGFNVTHYFLGEPVPRPVIHSITPSTGAPGDTILIAGENLVIPSTNSTSVAFKTTYSFQYAYPMRSESTEIEVVIPWDAVTGKIYVDNGSKIGASEAAFEVIE